MVIVLGKCTKHNSVWGGGGGGFTNANRCVSVGAQTGEALFRRLQTPESILMIKLEFVFFGQNFV